MSLTAGEARKIASSFDPSVELAPYVADIDKRIKAVAERGGMAAQIDPLHLSQPPAYHHWSLLRKHYEALGYKWEEFHDQRDGSSNRVISW